MADPFQAPSPVMVTQVPSRLADAYAVLSSKDAPDEVIEDALRMIQDHEDETGAPWEDHTWD